MTTPYSYQLKHDANGRITQKTETVSGNTVNWTYTYDKEGRLHEAHLDNRLVCQCHYDRKGRRAQDYFPRSVGSQVRQYRYTTDDRLQSAGNNGYTHDKQGFRSIWNSGGRYTLYEYAPDFRLLAAEVEGESTRFTFTHDDNGQRAAKYLNGELIEAYLWRDFTRMGAFHDGESEYEFAYEEESRSPFAMRRDDGAVAFLFYDQVGSLRVVADTSGNVIKEILYDPFGGIIEDTNPSLRIPIGFAGGLHDRDLGFVRFGWRDYDTFTSRWTAPDPMGDAGGDPDWYGYCLDDPVNWTDSLGLGRDPDSDGYNDCGGSSSSSGSSTGGGSNDTGGYRGNDFGKGYNGTSGSAYGPTPTGWGYKGSDPSPNDTGSGSPDSRTDTDAENTEKSRRSQTLSFSRELQRQKTEEAKQAQAAKEREERTRRALQEEKERRARTLSFMKELEEKKEEEVVGYGGKPIKNEKRTGKTRKEPILPENYNERKATKPPSNIERGKQELRNQLTPGSLLSHGLTLSTEFAKQRGNISPVTATRLGVLTAPIGDWISPSPTNGGHDRTVWSMEAAKGGYLDIFDTEEESMERNANGVFDAYR